MLDSSIIDTNIRRTRTCVDCTFESVNVDYRFIDRLLQYIEITIHSVANQTQNSLKTGRALIEHSTIYIQKNTHCT